jgi:hypothetical protein
MDKGPLLRIAELVSEPHLPKERFVECLATFASHMNCILETEEAKSLDGSPKLKPLEVIQSTDQSRLIIEAYLSSAGKSSPSAESSPDSKPAAAVHSRTGIMDLKTIGTSLQSVQEEDIEGEDDKDKGEDETESSRRSSKSDKPCKRSRVV